MEYFTHPESPENRSAENAVVKQLSGLAGGWMQIMGYCARQFRAGGFPGGSRDSDSGYQPDHGGHGGQDTRGFSRTGSAIPQPGARSLPAGEVRTARTTR
jgi:hypothetical protein